MAFRLGQLARLRNCPPHDNGRLCRIRGFLTREMFARERQRVMFAAGNPNGDIIWMVNSMERSPTDPDGFIAVDLLDENHVHPRGIWEGCDPDDITVSRESNDPKEMVTKEKLIHACMHCYVAGADKFCGKCKMIPYCSQECQKQDWCIHKEDCNVYGMRRCLSKNRLADAAAEGKVAEVQCLLQSHDVNHIDRYGYTPLKWAVTNNHLDVVMLLIDNVLHIGQQKMVIYLCCGI